MPANLLNLGNQFQVLLDDQYTSDNPGEELPNLGWDGLVCGSSEIPMATTGIRQNRTPWKNRT